MSMHCCSLMEDFLNDGRVQIFYSPRMREYYILLKDSSAIQCILYCPWCGTKLPEDVRDEYFNTLRAEQALGNINPHIDIHDRSAVLEEFKTDEWWKKRGL